MRSKAILALASTLLSLLAIELAVRASGYRYSALELNVGGTRTDWRSHHLFDEDHLQFDPQQIWKPKPGRSVFNAQGHRGPELPLDPEPGEIRILAVGDSNTVGSPYEPVQWPGELEAQLRAQGLDARVINGGIWGHSAYQGRFRLETLLPFQPDLVLVSYGANGAHLVHASDSDYVARIAMTPGRAWLDRSGIGQLVLKALDRFAGRSDGLVRRVSAEAYERHLHEMVATIRAAGARPYLVTRPFVGESSNELWWKHAAPRYVEATRHAGADLGVPVIDLHAAFADDPSSFGDESHFNADGHRRAAEIVAARIAAELESGVNAHRIR